MAKPICKSEARWKYWRDDGRWGIGDRFSRWAKRMMVKARRRYIKNGNCDF